MPPPSAAPTVLSYRLARTRRDERSPWRNPHEAEARDRGGGNCHRLCSPPVWPSPRSPRPAPMPPSVLPRPDRDHLGGRDQYHSWQSGASHRTMMAYAGQLERRASGVPSASPRSRPHGRYEQRHPSRDQRRYHHPDRALSAGSGPGRALPGLGGSARGMCTQALTGCPARSGSSPAVTSRCMRQLGKCIVTWITPGAG
jgi:hypothetical protein